MRKSIIVLAVLTIVIACSVASVSAIETCMPVKVIHVDDSHKGKLSVVVKNQDGDKFMFNNISCKIKIKVDQSMFMCVDLKYTKDDLWTMNDKSAYLAEKAKIQQIRR